MVSVQRWVDYVAELGRSLILVPAPMIVLFVRDFLNRLEEPQKGGARKRKNPKRKNPKKEEPIIPKKEEPLSPESPKKGVSFVPQRESPIFPEMTRRGSSPSSSEKEEPIQIALRWMSHG